MTDPTHDPQATPDELASAYLDGHASSEEARRVEADPALLARVAQLRGIREAVRAPGPPVDPARREAAIAAALLAAGHAPPVDELAAARSRRSARRWLPLAGIAAAIAAAALLVPQLGGDGGSDDTLASKTNTVEDRDAGSDGAGGAAASGQAGDDGATAEMGADVPPDRTSQAPLAALPGESNPTSAGAPAPSTGGSSAPDPVAGDQPAATTTTLATFEGGATQLADTSGVRDLGSFDDKASFTEAAQAAAAQPGTAAPADLSTKEQTGVDACVASLRSDAEADGGTVLLAAVADVADQAAVAIAVDYPDQQLRIVRVRHAEGCGIWFTRVLDAG